MVAMTAPATPLRVIAAELTDPGPTRPAAPGESGRLVWAADILRALTDHGYAVISTAGDGDGDWTVGADGRSNTSALYLRLQDEVTRLILNSATDLIAGRTAVVARLILSHLAHRHGFGPRPAATQPEEQA